MKDKRPIEEQILSKLSKYAIKDKKGQALLKNALLTGGY